MKLSKCQLRNPCGHRRTVTKTVSKTTLMGCPLGNNRIPVGGERRRRSPHGSDLQVPLTFPAHGLHLESGDSKQRAGLLICSAQWLAALRSKETKPFCISILDLPSCMRMAERDSLLAAGSTCCNVYSVCSSDSLTEVCVGDCNVCCLTRDVIAGGSFSQ